MAVLTVFSDNLSPNQGSLTARFTKATGFYIDAPLITSEIEIDVFLQVYFPVGSGERIRNLPLGKLKDGQITLNQTDSESLVTIDGEFVDSGLEMALFFLGSSTTFIEVYVTGVDCTLCEIKTQIQQLDERLKDIESIVSAIREEVTTSVFEAIFNSFQNDASQLLTTIQELQENFDDAQINQKLDRILEKTECIPCEDPAPVSPLLTSSEILFVIS